MVYRALGLGDFLTGVPAYRALANAFPHHRRLLVAPAALRPLVPLAGVFDELLAADPLAPVPDVGPVDVAVNLHGRGPESHRAVLARSPARLIAFEHTHVPESRGMPVWRPREHEVSRWCRLLCESGIPADRGDLGLDTPRLSTYRALAGAVVIHPGAASQARRWPPESFASVAAELALRGHTVVVTGGPDERDLADRIADRARLPHTSVLAGRTTLLELALLVAHARLVVCGDTGVGHLATALSTPSVVLFGPVSPAEWGPPPGGPHRAIWAGGRGDPHGNVPYRGLLRINVTDVLAAIDGLERAGASGRVA
jgi:ADP-heptose:LPS heptosyltransferase